MKACGGPFDPYFHWALIVLPLYGSKGDRGSVLLTTFSPELSVAPGVD